MSNAARTERPPVVVAGAYQTGVVLLRNLVRRKVESCLIDCDAAQPGFKTVYGKAHLCPNPDTHPDEWLRFMTELAKSTGRKPVLIASADQYVTAIAGHCRGFGAILYLPSHFGRNAGAIGDQEAAV